MDAPAIFLKLVREAIEAAETPPDRAQDALATTEQRARSILGGRLRTTSAACRR